MNIDEIIHWLKEMQGPAMSEAELYCAGSCYGTGELAYSSPEDYALYEAINALEQLKEYQHLEELIGIPLKDLTEILRQQIPDCCQHPKKAIVLTDGDVDEWREYKTFEEDDRLIKLPCKVGDKIYSIYRCFDDGVQELIVKGIHMHSYTPTKTILYIEFESDDQRCGGKLRAEELGRTLFLAKGEAEEKLKELRGDKNDN